MRSIACEVKSELINTQEKIKQEMYKHGNLTLQVLGNETVETIHEKLNTLQKKVVSLKEKYKLQHGNMYKNSELKNNKLNEIDGKVAKVNQQLVKDVTTFESFHHITKQTTEKLNVLKNKNKFLKEALESLNINFETIKQKYVSHVNSFDSYSFHSSISNVWFK
jgi:DNA repair exonuclease SbcCD ATPase subunit